MLAAARDSSVAYSALVTARDAMVTPTRAGLRSRDDGIITVSDNHRP